MGEIVERTAALRSGVRLPYAETGGAGAPDGRAAVVLVHAFVESWRYFEAVLRALPARVHALAPTQRGHRSVSGPAAGFEIGDLAADVVDFTVAVHARPVVLVGASSGGLVAQAVAAAHPHLVNGLVLIGSPVTLADKPGAAALRDEVLALSDPIDTRFVERFVRSTAPDGLPEAVVARLVQESLGLPAEVWRASLLGLLRADRPQALERIRVPTRLLCGSTDALVRDDQQVLLERIAGADLVLYDGVGHAPHLAHPRRVAADLTRFLDERLAPVPTR